MGNQNTEQNLHDFEITINAPKTDEEYKLLPEFEKLAAKVHLIKPKTSNKGTRANFCFALSAPYEGRYVWGSVPLHNIISSDTHLYQWTETILGKGVDVGAKFSLGDLIGKDILVVLKNSPNANNPERPYQNVTDLVQYTGAPKSAEVIEGALEEPIQEEVVAETEPVVETVAPEEPEDTNQDDIDLDLPF